MFYFLQNKISNRKWIAITSTMLLAVLLSLIAIYGIKEYGIALFFLVPFFIGAGASIILGYKNNITRSEAVTTGYQTLGIYCFGLVLFAIEGIICIVMALPIALLLTWLGSLSGYTIIRKAPDKGPAAMMVILLSFFITGFAEKATKPELTSVVTSVEINASPEQVWKNVIEFPQLKKPDELLFKAGIAYPINATIKGSGVGAVRYCNFTTGSFVEPITVWDENKLLQFDVVQQPEPMKEISFWDIDAPHLHDYFVSVKGQFKLIPLPNGNTLLEGTTWYYHDIKPAAYWELWSDYIIHKIHNRVLEHIKLNSEK